MSNSEPRVLNKRFDFIPADAVYVGRPSKWGNPFSHLEGTLAKFRVDTRSEAIKNYQEWLLDQPLLVAEAQKELRGKDLVCWCSPQDRHAEVLLAVANVRNEE